MKKLLVCTTILINLVVSGQANITKFNSVKQIQDSPYQNDTTREKNIAVIKAFFELMHQKKIDEWSNLWDDNGFIYIPYPVTGFPDTIKGKKTITEGFKGLFAGFRSYDYNIKEIYPSVDPDKIVVEYSGTAILEKNNFVYNATNIAVFKFRNGKIHAYHDYFNPEKFKLVAEAMNH